MTNLPTADERIAFFDCMSGISGDMTLGALVDAGVKFDDLQRVIQSLGIEGLHLESEQVKRYGFRATKIHVRHQPEHAHRHLHHVHEIIDRGDMTDSQRSLAKAIFQRLAEAEAKVHGSTLEKVHFHEVGAVDSIADIIGSAVGLDLLGVDRFECSPVPTGNGTITIAHGDVNVPAPATAELLRGVPIRASEIDAELTTPTGAAILATVVKRFGHVPTMTIEQIGYGAGDMDFKRQANVLRLLIGTTSVPIGGGPDADLGKSDEVPTSTDAVWMVESNLDDCNPEWIGHCLERVFESGALDAFSSSIQMKKGRPGVKLSVLVEDRYLAQVEQTLFTDTTTIGVRKWMVSRTKLERESRQVDTKFGKVAGKLVKRPGGVTSFAPEYESCRALAETHKIPLSVIYEAAQFAFAAET